MSFSPTSYLYIIYLFKEYFSTRYPCSIRRIPAELTSTGALFWIFFLPYFLESVFTDHLNKMDYKISLHPIRPHKLHTSRTYTNYCAASNLLFAFFLIKIKLFCTTLMKRIIKISLTPPNLPNFDITSLYSLRNK